MTARIVTAEVAPLGASTIDPFDPSRRWPHTAWKVTLRYDGRRMTVAFYTGSAVTDPPTARDVLECVISDALGCENATTFEDWSAEYGYGTDPGTDERQQAHRTYRAVVKQTGQLRVLLGNDYDQTINPTDGYLDTEDAAALLTGQTT